MNARLIAALSEFDASNLVDPEGFEHGYLVEEVREDQRDSEQSFYRTLAEAKRAFAAVELASEYDRVSIYECEACVLWAQFEGTKTRNETLISERRASEKEVAWYQAELDSWARRAQGYRDAYWQIRDWLDGATPAPKWA